MEKRRLAVAPNCNHIHIVNRPSRAGRVPGYRHVSVFDFLDAASKITGFQGHKKNRPVITFAPTFPWQHKPLPLSGSDYALLPMKLVPSLVGSLAIDGVRELALPLVPPGRRGFAMP